MNALLEIIKNLQQAILLTIITLRVETRRILLKNQNILKVSPISWAGEK